MAITEQELRKAVAEGDVRWDCRVLSKEEAKRELYGVELWDTVEIGGAVYYYFRRGRDFYVQCLDTGKAAKVRVPWGAGLVAALGAGIGPGPKHLPECGTKYRGCAPDCPFDKDHNRPPGVRVAEFQPDPAVWPGAPEVYTGTEFVSPSPAPAPWQEIKEVLKQSDEIQKQTLEYQKRIFEHLNNLEKVLMVPRGLFTDNFLGKRPKEPKGWHEDHELKMKTVQVPRTRGPGPAFEVQKHREYTKKVPLWVKDPHTLEVVESAPRLFESYQKGRDFDLNALCTKIEFKIDGDGHPCAEAYYTTNVPKVVGVGHADQDGPDERSPGAG